MERNPTRIGCELANLEEETMQRDEHNSYLYVSLCHNKEGLNMSGQPNPTIIIEEIHEPSSLVGGKS